MDIGRWIWTFKTTPKSAHASLSFLRQSTNPPDHRCPKSWHDFHLGNVLQRGCEYSKAIGIYGPPVFLWLNKSSVHPTELCHNAAKPGVCNGSQLPDTGFEGHIRDGLAHSASSRWNADDSEQTSTWLQRWSWPNPVWCVPPPILSRAKRAHLEVTTKTPSRKEQCIFCARHETLD